MFKAFVCFMQQQGTTTPTPARESSATFRLVGQSTEKGESQSGSFTSSETADEGQVRRSNCLISS